MSQGNTFNSSLIFSNKCLQNVSLDYAIINEAGKKKLPDTAFGSNACDLGTSKRSIMLVGLLF